MAIYNNQDQKNLEQLLEEGFWDRMKARGSQAVGAAKGIGQMAKGIGQSVVGTVSDDPELQRKSRESFQTGRNAGSNAKLDSYIKSIDTKISKMVGDVVNDLSKLGIDIPTQRQNLISGAFNRLKGNLTSALENLKTNYEDPNEPENDVVDEPEDNSPPPLPKESPPPLPKKKPSPKATKSTRPTPSKGKTSRDPLARHLAPEQEERFF